MKQIRIRRYSHQIVLVKSAESPEQQPIRICVAPTVTVKSPNHRLEILATTRFLKFKIKISLVSDCNHGLPSPVQSLVSWPLTPLSSS